MTPWLWMAMLGMVSQNATYAYDPIPHGVATGGMLVVVGIMEAAVKPSLDGTQACVVDAQSQFCDALHLWGWDQSVVGRKSLIWRRVSDVGMILAVGGPLLAAFIDNGLYPPAEGMWQGAGLDVLIALESVTLTTFINSSLKFAVRRARPELYGHKAATAEQDMSFPSGHVAATTAGVVTYAVTFALRHPHSPWRFVVMGGGAAVVGLTGYGRTQGGMHFYSDILAGAALGATVGFLVPYLAKRDIEMTPWVNTSAVEPGGDARPGGMGIKLRFNY